MPTEQEKQWIAAWRFAAIELPRIKARELRELTEEQGTMQATWLGLHSSVKARSTSGLIQFQALMQKWRHLTEKISLPDLPANHKCQQLEEPFIGTAEST